MFLYIRAYRMSIINNRRPRGRVQYLMAEDNLSYGML